MQPVDSISNAIEAASDTSSTNSNKSFKIWEVNIIAINFMKDFTVVLPGN